GLFWQLLDLLRDRDPARAAQVIRDSLDAADARVKDNARAALAFLPDGEAEAQWRRLLADPDPELRRTAIGYPPGPSPAIDAAAREAALRETDPKERGASLFTMFAARETAENLAFLVEEMKRDRDAAFRAAVLEWLPRYLTPRDASAVQALRDLAAD